MHRARRTTKRERKAAAAGYVAPAIRRGGVTFIVDEPAQCEAALGCALDSVLGRSPWVESASPQRDVVDALRGALGEFALDTREQTSKRIR